MKDIQEVIRQKEAQVQQLLKEIEALKTAAALLTEQTASRVPPGTVGAIPPAATAAEGGGRPGAVSPKRWP